MLCFCSKEEKICILFMFMPFRFWKLFCPALEKDICLFFYSIGWFRTHGHRNVPAMGQGHTGQWKMTSIKTCTLWMALETWKKSKNPLTFALRLQWASDVLSSISIVSNTSVFWFCYIARDSHLSSLSTSGCAWAPSWPNDHDINSKEEHIFQ